MSSLMMTSRARSRGGDERGIYVDRAKGEHLHESRQIVANEHHVDRQGSAPYLSVCECKGNESHCANNVSRRAHCDANGHFSDNFFASMPNSLCNRHCDGNVTGSQYEHDDGRQGGREKNGREGARDDGAQSGRHNFHCKNDNDGRNGRPLEFRNEGQHFNV